MATFVPQRALGGISAAHSGLDSSTDRSKDMRDSSPRKISLSQAGTSGLQGIAGISAEAIIKWCTRMRLKDFVAARNLARTA